MKISARFVLLVCLLCWLSVTSMAQRPASQEQQPAPADPIANELGLLRKSL